MTRDPYEDDAPSMDGRSLWLGVLICCVCAVGTVAAYLRWWG